MNTDIWGVSHKRIPNWVGTLRMDRSYPCTTRSTNSNGNTKDDLINLASGELSPELIPSDRFRTILSEKTFMENLGYDHPLEMKC